MDEITLPWLSGERQSLAGRIAASAAKAIVEGSIEPGALLTEADLAAPVGASRTPAREALLKLQAWGLVRLLPKKGGIVTVATDAQRRDLLDLRATLEIRAVESIADTPERRSDLADQLAELTAAQQAALDAGDMLRFAGLDFAFHLRIIEAAGNTVVAELLDVLGPRLARLTFRAINNDPVAAAGFRREHDGLATLVADGDVAGFARAVRSHLQEAHFRKDAR